MVDGYIKNNKWQKSIDGYVRRLTLSLAVNKDNDVRKNVAQKYKETTWRDRNCCKHI